MPPAFTGRGLPHNSCLAGLSLVLCFGAVTILIGLILSFLVLPWVDFTWWKVFRRCVSIAAALSLWLHIYKIQKLSLTSYGLGRSPQAWKDLRFGLLLGVGALSCMLLLGLATGVCRIEIHPDQAKVWRTVLGFIPAAALVAVLEELVFRGYILKNLLSCSKTCAILGSSFLYSVVHLKNTDFSLLTGLELGGLGIFGAILALSTLRTGSLYLAMGLHALLAYGARVNKLLIQFADPDLAWLFGTSRLVNGLTSWLILGIIAGIIVWWTKKRREVL